VDRWLRRIRGALGALFSIVLGIVGRSRRFDELSLPRFAALGALGGLLVSLIPAAMVGVGLSQIGREDAGLWTLTAVIIGPFTILSALSAAGSLMLARFTVSQQAVDSLHREPEMR
jgi:hypothetical protein